MVEGVEIMLMISVLLSANLLMYLPALLQCSHNYKDSSFCMNFVDLPATNSRFYFQYSWEINRSLFTMSYLDFDVSTLISGGKKHFVKLFF
jgi:hypothetical protein